MWRIVRMRRPCDQDDVSLGAPGCLYTGMADLSHPTRTAPDLDGGPTSSRTLLVTVVQAAEILSLSRSSIYQLIWSDQLVPIRIGRSVRFSVDQLERFVAERASQTLR